MDKIKELLSLGFAVRIYPVLPTDGTYYVAVSADFKNGCGVRSQSLEKAIEECLSFVKENNKF